MATAEGEREAASGKGRMTGMLLGDSFVCSFEKHLLDGHFCTRHFAGCCWFMKSKLLSPNSVRLRVSNMTLHGLCDVLIDLSHPNYLVCPTQMQCTN